MMLKKLFIVLFMAGLFIQCNDTTPSIIPLPGKVVPDRGYFRFDKGTVITVRTQEQVAIAGLLTDLFTSAAGFTPEIRISTDEHERTSCTFYINEELPAEHYKIEISPSHIHINAADTKGFFYAVQSLRMMLPAAIESKEIVSETEWQIPCMQIEDGPRFAYRGLMLDVSRTFIPKENVKTIIDCMAMLKLNTLHFHLTDGNGWRLEIKKYPKLTDIGAWRADRKDDFAQRRNAVKGEPTPIGGFYTQEDIKELVVYAAERQVEIIPEIEMPAHSNAAIAAYPELACPVIGDFIGVLPGIGGNEADIVYCAGNDSVFSFLQNVIDEVAELFPSPYINIGGDEASKEYWKKCPLCQARMQAEGITDAEELQGYFMNRIAGYVKSKGKQVIGWEEWINSKAPEDAIIIGWTGNGEAGYKAGLIGHSFIMSPAKALYLIRYQGPQWFEPRTYFGNNTLKDVYDYEPIAPDWEPRVVQHLMGIQGCLWTEFLNTPQDAEYLLFPRLAALAETAWAEPGTKNWPDFLKRLDQLTEHYNQMGIQYARSMYNLDHRVYGENGVLKVSLSCIRPDMEIRYTTDETEPTANAELYKNVIEVSGSGTIKAATFSKGVRMGKTLILPLNGNKATACPILYGNDQTYRLTNGLRGSDKHSDFEWCGWYNQDTSFVIDLQKEETVNNVTVGCITNYGMGVHIPKCIRLSISDDDKKYTVIGEKKFTAEEIFKEGIRIEDKMIEGLNTKGRYLKIEIENPGKCPQYHVRPGLNTWVYIDEIRVE